MELFVTRSFPPATMERLARSFTLHRRSSEAPLDEGEAARALAGHRAILCTLRDRFTAAAFARAAREGGIRTRILANFGVGVDHIDLAAARAHGVQVTNTPGAVTDATADLAMTLLLMAARRAGEGERLVRSGRWEGWHPTQMLGLHVTGKTLGILGMGRIGRAVARRAHHGFGMRILFHNRSPVANPGVLARQVADMAELARESDAVVVTVPGGPATRHLVGAPFFAAMRPHAVFVNVSRGDVVDEQALIAALEAGRPAAAGLDVYEHEPAVPPALRARENAVLLPHLGTAALEVREAMGAMAAENLEAFAAGRALPNPVEGG